MHTAYVVERLLNTRLFIRKNYIIAVKCQTTELRITKDAAALTAAIAYNRTVFRTTMYTNTRGKNVHDYTYDRIRTSTYIGTVFENSFVK